MLTAIILTIVLIHIFLFIVRCSFVVCISSSKLAVFKISLSAIFHTIDDFLIFQEGFPPPFFDTSWFGSMAWRDRSIL